MGFELSVLIQIKHNTVNDRQTRQAYFLSANRSTTVQRFYTIVDASILTSPSIFKEINGRPWYLYNGNIQLQRSSGRLLGTLYTTSLTSLTLDLVIQDHVPITPIDPISPLTGRTIRHQNLSGIPLDLYLTRGGSTPAPLTKIQTIPPNGYYDFPIPSQQDASYNFNVLPEGDAVPLNNAGPTLAEFGTNANVPGGNRDTMDISCVPASIGNLLCNDGQPCRDQAVALCLASGNGYTVQQAYNYNVGVRIIPPMGTAIPSGNLQTVSVTDPSAPYATDAITYPLDTAVPKQQTGVSEGAYTVQWIQPVVSLGSYPTT